MVHVTVHAMYIRLSYSECQNLARFRETRKFLGRSAKCAYFRNAPPPLPLPPHTLFPVFVWRYTAWFPHCLPSYSQNFIFQNFPPCENCENVNIWRSNWSGSCIFLLIEKQLSYSLCRTWCEWIDKYLPPNKNFSLAKLWKYEHIIQNLQFPVSPKN